MIWAFAWYIIFTMACALAPNFAALVVFRFLAGVGAACPLTVVGGTCADVYKNPEARGRAMAIFMGATTFGSVHTRFRAQISQSGANKQTDLALDQSFQPTYLRYPGAGHFGLLSS